MALLDQNSASGEDSMKSRFLTHFGHTSAAILTVAFALATTATAQSTASAAPSLQGTWRVQVTLYKCSDPHVTNPPFWSLLSFNQGGTETETTSNPALQPGQRTAGEGFWKPKGANTYFSATEAFILFDSGKLKKGVQKILQSIDLTDENHFRSKATVKFFNADGTTVTGCAKAEAVRLTGRVDKP
jgi:hypothetical protein